MKKFATLMALILVAFSLSACTWFGPKEEKKTTDEAVTENTNEEAVDTEKTGKTEEEATAAKEDTAKTSEAANLTTTPVATPPTPAPATKPAVTSATTYTAPASTVKPIDNSFFDSLNVSFSVTNSNLKLEVKNSQMIASTKFFASVDPKADFRVYCTSNQNVLNVYAGTCAYKQAGDYKIFMRVFSPDGRSRDYGHTWVRVTE